MQKSTVLCITMFVALVGGLWGVIQYGRHLRAAHDIGGKWVVLPIEREPHDDRAAPKTFAIAQSGRFVKVRQNGGEPMSLRLRTDEVVEPGDRRLTLESDAGDNQSLTILAPADLDGRVDGGAVYRFHFTGPYSAIWSARREDKPAAPATKPSPTQSSPATH